MKRRRRKSIAVELEASRIRSVLLSAAPKSSCRIISARSSTERSHARLCCMRGSYCSLWGLTNSLQFSGAAGFDLAGESCRQSALDNEIENVKKTLGP